MDVLRLHVASSQQSPSLGKFFSVCGPARIAPGTPVASLYKLGLTWFAPNPAYEIAALITVTCAGRRASVLETFKSRVIISPASGQLWSCKEKGLPPLLLAGPRALLMASGVAKLVITRSLAGS